VSPLPHGIGALRHRVSIQSVALTADSRGGGTQTWTTITSGTRWASITPTAGSEAFARGKLEPFVSHVVIIRYLSTVTPAMRVLFGTRAFRIHSVINADERKEYLTLHCEEVAL